MPKVSANTIADAAMEGLGRGADLFGKITGDGEYIAFAPEYVFTVGVAETIVDLKRPIQVWPEYSVRAVTHEAGAKTRGKPSRRLNGSGRFDLVVYKSDGETPIGIIEVKRRPQSFGAIEGDFERIVTLLKKNAGLNCLDFGLIVFPASQARTGAISEKTAKQRIEGRITRIKDGVVAACRKQGGIVCEVRVGDMRRRDAEDWWRPVVVILKRA